MWVKCLVLVATMSSAALCAAEIPVVDMEQTQQAVVSQSTVMTLQRLHAMTQEIRDLRGELELLRHELALLKQSQKQVAIKPQTMSAMAAKTSKPIFNISKDLAPEEQAYQLAYHMVKTNRYDEAKKAFKTFIEAYPKHRYVINSQYWLGELYLAQQKWDKARHYFNAVLNTNPKHPKAADALLKLGLLEQKTDKPEKATIYFNQVIKNYPNSGAAQLATAHLS